MAHDRMSNAVQPTSLSQIGDNTYMYTGPKKEKADKAEKEGGASTTEDEDDDMLGDEAVLISRSADDVEEAHVREFVILVDLDLNIL